MALQWVSAELATGRVIADLPSLDVTFPLRRTISNYDAGTGILHLAGAPENWERAIEEANSVLACYDDTVEPDGSQPRPVLWAGYVTVSERDAFADDVPITVATFEAVLDRAPVGDVTYSTTDHRDDIIADLINTWVIGAMGISCLQLAYTLGGGPTPPLMDSPPVPNAAFVMQNTDNASAKARMDQVFGQLGGEYTVEWAFSADNEFLVPTLRFGSRIGTAAAGGQDPAVTFELGVLTGFKQRRDYSAGKGANKVVAYSSGQGSTTPYAAPVFGPPDGRPVFEYRYQPAPSISPTALEQYAAQAIKILAPGARSITMTATTATTHGRRLGVDWVLGDDVGYRIPAAAQPDPVPAITGSFIQESVALDGWAGPRWDQELADMDLVGMKTSVLQWTLDEDNLAQLFPGAFPAASGAVAGSWFHGSDYVDNLLFWAGAHGHDVWLGLANYGAWQAHATDGAWLANQLTLSKQVADLLIAQFGTLSQFVGFYLPFEVDAGLLSTPAAIAPMTSFFNDLIDYLHATYPGRRVMVSPTYSYTGVRMTPAAFADALLGVQGRADVVAVQDGGGNQTAATIRTFFAALADRFGSKLWSNADMFYDVGGGPQPIARLAANLAAAAPYVQKFIGFSFPTQMGPHDLSSAAAFHDYAAYVAGPRVRPGDAPVPAFPNGLVGVGRAIGYELTETTVSPILAEAEIYTEDGA